jgi:hypothetical protein
MSPTHGRSVRPSRPAGGGVGGAVTHRGHSSRIAIPRTQVRRHPSARSPPPSHPKPGRGREGPTDGRSGRRRPRRRRRWPRPAARRSATVDVVPGSHRRTQRALPCPPAPTSRPSSGCSGTPARPCPSTSTRASSTAISMRSPTAWTPPPRVRVKIMRTVCGPDLTFAEEHEGPDHVPAGQAPTPGWS